MLIARIYKIIAPKIVLKGTHSLPTKDYFAQSHTEPDEKF